MDTRTKDEFSRINRLLGTVQRELASIPVRHMLPNKSESFRIAIAEPATEVGSNDSPFAAKIIRMVRGTDPRQNPTDNVQVRNSYQLELSPGSSFLIIERSDASDNNGDWEMEFFGDPGNPPVFFELTEDLARDSTFALAKPLISSGQIDDEAAEFYVLDPRTDFVGRAAWTDALGEHIGYQGCAQKVTDDFTNETPGYRIIAMQGPLLLIAVTLATDQNDEVAETPVVPIEAASEDYGTPFSRRFPEAESATGQFKATDPYGVAKGAKQGDQWAVIYSAADDAYHFWMRLEPEAYHTARGKIGGTVDRSMSTIELNSCEAVDGREPPATITATVLEYAKMDIPASYTGWVYVKWNERVGSDDASHWDAGDARNLDWMLRGKAGFDASLYQAFVTDGPNEADRKWVECVDQVIFLADPAPTITLSNPTATSLRVKIDGQKRSVKVIPNAAATALSIQQDIGGTNCA